MLATGVKTALAGLVCLGLVTTGCASEMFKKAGVESTSGKVSEAGLIISQNKFLPETIESEANEVVRVWIVNLDDDPVQVTANSDARSLIEIKPKQIAKFDLQNPKVGRYELRAAGKSGAMIKAVVNVAEHLQNQQVVIIRDFQAFFPIKTRISAGSPLQVYTAAVTWAPHSDFVIYGTDIKLPFQDGEVGQFEIKDGLKAGTYPISRPNHPGQNHNIKSLISAE